MDVGAPARPGLRERAPTDPPGMRCSRARYGLVARAGFFALCTLMTARAAAFTVSITMGPEAIYLQVGTGSFSGLHHSGGTPLANPNVNVVSATIPPVALLTGAEQQMTSDSAQAISFYDGRILCTPPDQVYIGGFYRRPNQANRAALLSVTAPPALLSPTGDRIPFSQIRWTSSGIGDSPAARPVRPGTFVPGGTLFLAEFRRNTWSESCLTFYFASAPAAGGTYEGRVTYTLTAP